MIIGQFYKKKHLVIFHGKPPPWMELIVNLKIYTPKMKYLSYLNPLDAERIVQYGEILIFYVPKPSNHTENKST
jgi:hypothetical protein